MSLITVKELLENLTLIPPEHRDKIVMSEEEGRLVCIGWPRITPAEDNEMGQIVISLDGPCASDFDMWGTYYLPKPPKPTV